MTGSKRHIDVVLCVLVAACGAPPAVRNADEVGAGPPAAYLGGVTTATLRAHSTGREYQLSVAVPLGYDSTDTSYPVLVGLDANGLFGSLVETARLLELGGQLPPVIVVGVGFPVGGYQLLSETRRPREMTPTQVEDYAEKWKAVFPPGITPPDGTGGASEFLGFLTQDAIPWVDEQFRTDTTGRALYGHSLGGLFALYALLESHGAFTRFVISSPSLWWDDRAAFALEAAYAVQRSDLPARAFFSVGLDEFDGLRPGMKSGRMISNLRQLLAIFQERGYQHFVWNSQFFEGENHQSVVGPAMSRGLRYIYSE